MDGERAHDFNRVTQHQVRAGGGGGGGGLKSALKALQQGNISIGFL